MRPADRYLRTLLPGGAADISVNIAGGRFCGWSGQGSELALEQAALALVSAEPYGELDLMPCIVKLPEAAEQFPAHARKQMRAGKAARRNQIVDDGQGGRRAVGN